MNSLLAKFALLAGGTSAVGGSTVFLEHNRQSDLTPTFKTIKEKIPSQITRYEDILPIQRSRGCNFWLVEKWSERKIVGPARWEQILMKDRTGDKTVISDKETSLLSYINSTYTEKCKNGAQLMVHYKEGKTWDLHDGTDQSSLPGGGKK
nr:hypothetical protein [Mycoplasma haemocanis]